MLFELSREANKTQSGQLSGLLNALGGVLGLLQTEPTAHLRGGDTGGYSAARIDQLLAERLDARQARDFTRADAIRKELTEAGILIEDGAQGTSWRRG